MYSLLISKAMVGSLNVEINEFADIFVQHIKDVAKDNGIKLK
jgi:hypothetical protein